MTSHLIVTPTSFVVGVVALILYIGITLVRRSRKLSHLPVAEGDPINGNFAHIMMSAMEKYPGQAFVLPTAPPTVILPNHLVDDVKNERENVISFSKEVEYKMHGAQTGLKGATPEMVGAVRENLTRGIQRTLADLQDENTYAFDTEIGACEEWSQVYLMHKLPRIVALISGRVFVGLPLCRNEKWINATINFTMDAMEGIRAVDSYHPLLRPVVAPFIAEMKKLKEYRRWATEMMEPYTKVALADRKATGNAKKNHLDDEEPEQANFIQWVLNHHKDPSEFTSETLAFVQLATSFAAIHTTSMTATYALLDMAQHPEYIPELRQEIEEVLAEEGHGDGFLRKTSMPKLRKLDSFIRESQRYNPLGIITMTRMVTSPTGYTIPNTTTTLPQGTSIAFAHPYSPDRTSTTLPPSILTRTTEPPLSEFHPFRFYTLRTTHPGEEQKHQFVTTGSEHLGSGHGAKACPGRFFASNEIKIILVEFLRRFDLALGEGGKGVEDGVVRPKAMSASTSFFPDPTSSIWVKARKSAAF